MSYNLPVQIVEKTSKIGLMGGTFDPIHYGHLFIAEEARVCCELKQVLFFPNNQPAPVLNKSAPTEGEIRLQLVELAIAGNEYFQASRVELDRPGPSYTFDTIQHLRQQYPEAELHYIVGADSINEVLTWHRGAELFEHCRFIAASRPGFDLEQAKQKLSRHQLERVTFLTVPGLQIASRDLRARVQNDLPIRYLVPEDVRAEIKKLNLYHGKLRRKKHPKERHHSRNN